MPFSQFVQFIKASHNSEPLFSFHRTSWTISHFFGFHEKSSHSTCRVLFKAAFHFHPGIIFSYPCKKVWVTHSSYLLNIFLQKLLWPTLLFFYINCINTKVEWYVIHILVPQFCRNFNIRYTFPVTNKVIMQSIIAGK